MFTIVITLNDGRKSRPFTGMSLSEALLMKKWAYKHIPTVKKVRLVAYKNK